MLSSNSLTRSFSSQRSCLIAPILVSIPNPGVSMSLWHSKHPQSSLKSSFNVFIDTSYDISKHMGYKLLPCRASVYSNPCLKTNSAFPDDFISSHWLTCLCLFKLLLRVFLKNIQHFWNIKKTPWSYLQISDTFERFCLYFMGATWLKSPFWVFTAWNGLKLSGFSVCC